MRASRVLDSLHAQLQASTPSLSGDLSADRQSKFYFYFINNLLSNLTKLSELPVVSSNACEAKKKKNQ